MVKELYNENGFSIIEQSTLLVFNFRVGEDVFGFSIAKDGLSPDVFSAAATNLRDLIKSKT